MTDSHRVDDDIVYDLISIQYHSMKSAQVYRKYLEDAHDHDEVADFIMQCQQEDRARASRCHDLIKLVMGADQHQAA